MIEIVEADLTREEHRRDVLALTAAYGADPMGTGAPLPPEVLGRLIEGLRAMPTALILLAYEEDEAGRRALGIATCFVGFSTFHARRLVNIHDLAVRDGSRGKGVGRALLAAVEERARALDCCKVTLEVHENNPRARQLYEQVGFRPYGSDTLLGGAAFYAKLL